MPGPANHNGQSTQVTQLLDRLRAGEAGAAEQVLPLVYEELHDLARAMFADQQRGHTLQPTALINEAYLKMAGHLDGLEGRRHFMRVAARAMRQVLRDHARGKGRLKRGGPRRQVTLDERLAASEGVNGIDLVAFDDALERLSTLHPRHAEVVELRLLGTLTIAETADLLGVSHSTVESDWTMAKAWLRAELADAS